MPFDLAITMAVWFKKIPFGRDKDPTDIVLCFILRDGTYSLSLNHCLCPIVGALRVRGSDLLLQGHD